MSIDGTRAESDLHPPFSYQQVLRKAVHLHRLFSVRWELSRRDDPCSLNQAEVGHKLKERYLHRKVGKQVGEVKMKRQKSHHLSRALIVVFILASLLQLPGVRLAEAANPTPVLVFYVTLPESEALNGTEHHQCRGSPSR